MDFFKNGNKSMLQTAEQVQKFFADCKAFWMRNGDTEGIATSKAFWWDCVEAWNFDANWNEAKAEFALAFRGYKPGDPVPDSKVVEKGGV